MPAREDSESQKFLENVLDAIEQREARLLLVWGLVDGRLSRDEIEAVIDPLLDEALEKGPFVSCRRARSSPHCGTDVFYSRPIPSRIPDIGLEWRRGCACYSGFASYFPSMTALPVGKSPARL